MSDCAGYDLVQHLGDRIKTRFYYVAINCNYSILGLQLTVEAFKIPDDFFETEKCQEVGRMCFSHCCTFNN